MKSCGARLAKVCIWSPHHRHVDLPRGRIKGRLNSIVSYNAGLGDDFPLGRAFTATFYCISFCYGFRSRRVTGLSKQ